MRNNVSHAFLCMILLVGMPAFAGAPDGVAVRNAGEGEAAVRAEPPKPLPRVEVSNGRLSVDLVDAGFGEVMKMIAERSGIKVEIIGSVAAKTVSTSFRNLDLERGIVRLLTLVQERNYMIRYDSKGMMSKVEVYSSGAAPVRPAAAAKPQTRAPAAPFVVPPAVPPANSPSRNMPVVRKNPPVSKRILSPLRETETNRSASKGTRAEEKGDADSEEYEEETPLEPAGNIPAYIPPRRPGN